MKTLIKNKSELDQFNKRIPNYSKGNELIFDVNTYPCIIVLDNFHLTYDIVYLSDFFANVFETVKVKMPWLRPVQN